MCFTLTRYVVVLGECGLCVSCFEQIHFAKEPVRYRNMTWEQFDENLRNSVPFIITDAAERWAASKVWNAEVSWVEDDSWVVFCRFFVVV